MKKLFCFNLIIVSIIIAFAVSSSAAILPPNSRAFTGRITKIFKNKSKRDFMIKVQTKNKSIVVSIPQNDPLNMMTSVKKFKGRVVTIIYSLPDMTIINIKKQVRKKGKKY